MPTVAGGVSRVLFDFPFQLQHRFVAGVVLVHPAAAVYPVHGGRDADLTPRVISKGKASGW